jgi:DNA-binding transcriptional LysR family regulator
MVQTPDTVIEEPDNQRGCLLSTIYLKTFMMVANVLSFSEASRRLGIAQSSVSEHVKKLEKQSGHRLFVRDTHSMTLTPQGEEMLEFARVIVDANERASRHFAGLRKRHRLRFGACEDCVAAWVPEVLRNFIVRYPQIDLEYTIALSVDLIAKFDAGELDVVLCKRRPNNDRGILVGRDPIVWVSSGQIPLFSGKEIQLILYPPPSITRFMALTALERAAIPWRISCTSDSLSGLATAACAGLGVMAHSRTFVPEGLVECGPVQNLPPIGEAEFALFETRGRLKEPITQLREAILAKSKDFF